MITLSAVVTASRCARAKHDQGAVAEYGDGRQGWHSAIEIQGVGFKGSVAGKQLTLNVGYSHPVEYTVPEGVEVSVTDGTQIKVSGIDKQLVGQVSARIRSFRPPEPYKGKGVRYKDEHVQRKAGKTVT